MSRRRICCVTAALFAAGSASGANASELAAQATESARAVAEQIWEAESSGAALDVALAAARANDVSFEAMYAALRDGRTYSSDVSRGTVVGRRQGSADVVFPYFVQVPESYTPDRTYPVRVFLHGGVSREAWDPSSSPGWWRSPDRVASEDYIGVFPAAWGTQRWWQSSQLENLAEILRVVRSDYNVDENRVSLIGVSDGGTGAYFVAFRATTLWASFLPFISHPAVLQNPRVGATGEIFRTNLTNKPLFIVNGETDRLYPTRSVDPFIADFSAAGVEMVYRPLDGVGHELSWWPDEAANIEAFIDARPRDPHPTCVSWETESPELAGRAHWLVIDELAATRLDATFEASDLVDPGVFSGRVDAQRIGNEIRLRSARVRQVTLLISPDVSDLSEPISVWWNGVLVHDAAVEPSAEVLIRRAAEDDDRTMLYGAELTLSAPETAGSAASDHAPEAPGSAVCRGL